MRPRQRPAGYGWRGWLSPSIAVAVSLCLLVMPPSSKAWLARALESSFLFPFRFAVGWGPRSLQTQQECARLGRELAERRYRTDREWTTEAENARLRRLLGFTRRGAADLMPGAVVSHGRARAGDFIVAEFADAEGIAVGQAVLSPDGLVGRVQSRQGSHARIECLSHPDVAVSVLNQRSGEGGILKWDPLRSVLVIEGVASQSDWQRGDRLVTSGLGRAFPRGILVGWVVGETRERGGLLKAMVVRAAAIAAREENVFVLTSPHTDVGEQDLSALYPADGRQGPGGVVRNWVSPMPAPWPAP